MKFVNLVLINSIIFVRPPITPIVDPIVDPIVEINPPKFTTNEVYGPFDGKSDETIRFYLTSGDVGWRRISFNFSYVQTEAIFSTASYTIRDLLGGNNYFDIVFPLKNRMGYGGVNVDIDIKEINGEIIDNLNFDIYPTANDVIYSYNYRNKSYSIENRIFKIANSIVRSKEEVSFKDTIDYITNSRDNSIEISEIAFKYNSNFTLKNVSTNHCISFDDDKEIFPNIFGSNNNAEFPIKIIQNGNDVSLEYNFDYYLNTKNYEMYVVKPILFFGKFISVDEIYSSDQHLLDLELIDINVVLNHVLLSGTTIIIPLQFIKDKNRVGYCSTSSNCIIGGIKE